MEIITFNTGRLYSEKGQRIAACVDNERVHFNDIDRSIDGWFSFTGPPENLTQELVMVNYDHGNYIGTSLLSKELADAASAL